jgi:GNAT superfamily N-acetyltransferase
MQQKLEIRHPRLAELRQARQIAADTMNMLYRHLPAGVSLVPPQLEPWQHSWIALVADEIVGVGRTADDRVSDLWLLPQARGKQVGSRLLERLEAEIEQRKHAQARLHLVAENTPARAFYRVRGWREADSFAHEKLGIPMINMYKPLGPKGANEPG